MTQEKYLKNFRTIIERMWEITKIKNSDYAGTEDAFKNFNLAEKVGLASSEQACLVRMGDKFQRLCNLLKKDPAVVAESFEDTCMDLAVYSIILSLLHSEKV